MKTAVKVANEQPARDRLLTAAELLILEQGYHAVRTRALATRAGLQMAMIRYCFGGIDELMSCLLQHNLDRFNDAQKACVAALPGDATRRDVLYALFAPMDVPAAFTPNLRAAFVIEDILVHANETIRTLAENRLQESFLPLLDRLAATCPHLTRESVIWRFSCICEGALGMSPRSPAWQLYRSITQADPATGQPALDELIALACGAFEHGQTAGAGHSAVRYPRRKPQNCASAGA